MGIAQQLRQFGKASESIMRKLLPPEPGMEDLAAAVGYVEYAGSPVGVLTPDFIGQRCQDTTTGLFYVAQTLTSAGWVLAVNSPNAAASCMWLGDSLTQYGKQMHPFMQSRIPFYDLTASPSTYAIFVNVPFGVPTGNGTLQYTKATRTMTWAANGVSAGAPVDVSTGGFFTLTDAGGNKCHVGLRASTEPGADSTITVNVTGTAATKTARLDSFSGWADALLGFPFGEASYNYGLAGTRASDVWAYRSQWQNFPTDITVIHLGTNNITAMSDVTPCLTNMQNIIQARIAVGSRPIVGLLFPEEFNSTAVRQAKVVYNMRLRALCDTLGVDCFDGGKFVADPSATTVFAVDTTCYRSDKLHLNGKGGYKVAKYALVPVLTKYVRQKAIEL